MKNKELKFYQGNDEWEVAQLRSILLFSEFGKSDRRSDMMPEVLFSYIIKEEGEATISSITKQFNHNFGTEYNDADIAPHIEALKRKALVRQENGRLIAISDENKGEEFFKKLDEDTNALVDSIINRYMRLKGTSHLQNSEVVRGNILKALSAYFKMESYSIVNAKDTPAVNDSIRLLISEMQKQQGELLISALGEVLDKPSEKDKEVLNKWARAHILTQILRMDPSLSEFKASLLIKKSFVLDTDVVLNLIVNNAHYSKSYKILIDKLKEIGCAIYVPPEIIKEVEGHAKQALSRYENYGKDQIDNFTDYELSNSHSNVFIEDYVRLRRAKPNLEGMDFDVYIHNICYEGQPSVLKNKIRSIVGDGVKFEMTPVDIKEDEQSIGILRDALVEQAENSAKGTERTKGVNVALSEVDARMYFLLCKCNGKLPENGFLKLKFYFLTQSTRTARVANSIGLYKQDVFCRPEALMTVLSEIGGIPKGNVSLINLLENPFLVHAADAVWERVTPILKEKIQVSYKDLEQLRADVDLSFDELLCASNVDEKIKSANKYRERGYSFANDLLVLSDRIKKLESENTELKKQNKKKEILSRSIEELEKEIEHKRHLNRFLSRISKKWNKNKKTLKKKKG